MKALGGEVDYLVADEAYVFDEKFSPRLDSRAPAHILIPGLQELFWYGDLEHRDSVPIAFLDLKDCSG
ncbi:MAG: hypothetical protein ACYDD1_20090 [Caulobacteraceae bacterium]